MSSARRRATRWVSYAIALGSGSALALVFPPAGSRAAHGPTPPSTLTSTTFAASEPREPPIQLTPSSVPEDEHTTGVGDRSVEAALGTDFKQGMTITGVTGHRSILFTFDDGPDPRTTPLLLDRLDEAGVKAIFFLVAGRMAEDTPVQREQALLAREIVRRGHMIGGHTVDHVQLPLLDDDDVRAQMIGAENVLQRVIGARPFIYRPPFGAHSQRIDQLAAARGYTTVLWNLGGDDFHARTAQEVYDQWRRDLARGSAGGIVLLHDIHPWSVDAFQLIVSHLLARNCELLERGEELFDFVDDLSAFYVPRGNAPAESEAPPVEPDPQVLAQRQAKLRERTARRCKSMARAD